LTHLRCRLPRLLIAAGGQGSGGGEQVQQGLLGDADAAADADRAQFATGDRLVELVAPDPQDRGGLADGEHLGQRGQRTGGVGEVEGRPEGGRLGVGAVARIGGGWPLVLLGAWCCGRRQPTGPAVVVGGGGTIPRSRALIGVFSLVGGLIVQLVASEPRERSGWQGGAGGVAGRR
jgi:hypothetical protein